MIIEEDKSTNVMVLITIAIYPFLPLIKEWNFMLGTVIEAVLLVLLFASTTLLLQKRGPYLSVSRIFLILTIFLFVYLVMNTGDLFGAFSGFRTIFLYLIFYMGLCNHKPNLDYTVVLASKVCMTVGMLMSIGAIVQFVYPNAIKLIHNPQTWTALREKTNWVSFSIYNRSLSFMSDPNVLSVFLCFCLFISVIYFKRNNNGRIQWFMYAIFTIAILLTQSRTGIFVYLLYALASFLIKILAQKKISRIQLIVVITLVVAGVGFMIVFWNQIMSYLRVDTLLSGNGRVARNAEQLKESLENVSMSLLIGNGLFDGRTVLFENSYLLILYMFGIFGTVMFIRLGYTFYRNLFSADNLAILLCYAAALLVGDYILIPQITLVVIVALALKRYYAELGRL